jgi:thymidylate synthase ThyX
MKFEKGDEAILEHYVTSAEDNIFAVRNTVPPEVFGAFGSYFSRNPKDFREHLLDAVKGKVEGESAEVGEDDLRWLIDGNFKDPSSAISEGLAKAQDFFTKWYGKYSHKSIANTVWVPVVASNVSQLFARELAYDQLAFFIEQSTRYVKWDVDNMFLDPDIMDSNHSKTLLNSLKTSVEGYSRLTDIGVDFYEKRNPFKDWLERQNDRIKNDGKLARSTYNRQIKGAALDVARFLLPQACKTNIAWILDARSTEFDIAAWKGHPLNEMRKIAESIEEHAGQIVPSLLKYTEESSYFGEKLRGYDGVIGTIESPEFEKGVRVISHDPDALNKSLSHIFKRHSFGGTFQDMYNHVSQFPFGEKIKWLEEFTRNRQIHDEWVETDEDFDLVKMTFEVLTDIGATRDWRRHQKWDRGETLYSLKNGYQVPFMLPEMGDEAQDIFHNVMNDANNAEKEIGNEFRYQAQYVLPMATMHSITMSAGLDQLQYMVWTRTTPQGNFSYREDAFNIAEAAVKTHPWLLGYEHYPSLKNFREIYDEAPLKGLLRLQTGETALHV